MNSSLSAGPVPHIRRRRALTVAAAVVAAILIWLAAVAAGGADLFSERGSGNPPAEIGLGAVVVSSLIISLAAWGLLVLLEKTGKRGRLIWTVIAVAVLVISLAGPFTATTTGGVVTLVLLHLVVGGILIAGLPRR